MPFSQFSERAVLDLNFGDLVGQVNGTINAPATTQTTLTVTGSAAGGSMFDLAVVSGMVFLFATPANPIGSATLAPNTYTNIDIITASGANTGGSGNGNIMHFASQSIGKNRAPGDAIFYLGPQTGLTPAIFNNTWYIGLSTTASGSVNATGSTLISSGAEPTIGTGSYARIAVINNVANWVASTGAQPATKATGATLAFPASSAAWSTGSTNLATVFLCDSPTGTTVGTNVNILGWGSLTTPQAVNAASITLSFATGALTVTLN